DAQLIRRLYNFSKLNFSHSDVRRLNSEEVGHFDVVLMLDLLTSFENPINAVRIAKSMTKKLLIVETPVAPEADGEVDIGVEGVKRQLRGTFALFEQGEETSSPAFGSTKIALYPGREALIFLLNRVGFSRIEIVPAPEVAGDLFTSGKRIMVA